MRLGESLLKNSRTPDLLISCEVASALASNVEQKVRRPGGSLLKNAKLLISNSR